MKSTQALAWGMLISMIAIIFYLIGMTALVFESWFIGVFTIFIFIIGIITSLIFNCIFVYKELFQKEVVKKK